MTDDLPTIVGSDESTQQAKPKILCIEGHSSLRDLLAQLLTLKNNFEIDVAGNGLEGVQKARAWQPDLIIMGLRLAVMDGYETIKVIRRHPVVGKTPIIVISAWADATSKRTALSAGANEHLTPPVDLSHLLRRINWYLSRED